MLHIGQNASSRSAGVGAAEVEDMDVRSVDVDVLSVKLDESRPARSVSDDSLSLELSVCGLSVPPIPEELPEDSVPTG